MFDPPMFSEYNSPGQFYPGHLHYPGGRQVVPQEHQVVQHGDHYHVQEPQVPQVPQQGALYHVQEQPRYQGDRGRRQPVYAYNGYNSNNIGGYNNETNQQ